MITQERLKELLNYNESTGEFVWIRPTSNRVKQGSVAGAVRDDACITISVDGKEYKAHRLAWLYIYGELPVREIDHKNCNPIDNRISNLRLSDRVTNNQNKGRASNNKTGYKGVYFVKRTKMFCAQININGKPKYLGSFTSAIEAYACYVAEAKKLYGEFLNLS